MRAVLQYVFLQSESVEVMNGSTRWPHNRQGKVCWNLHTCPCQTFHSIPPDSSSTLCIKLFCEVSILIQTQPAVFLDISKLLMQGIFINFISLANKKLQVNYNTQIKCPCSHHNGTQREKRYSSTQSQPSCQLYTPATLHLVKNPSTQRMGGWVGPRTGLDGFGEGKTLPLPGFEPQTVWPVASCYILCYIGSCGLRYYSYWT